MISLTTRLGNYLAIRRSLGYDLSFQERVLRRFTGFADARGVDHVTVNLFLAWKTYFGSANQQTWSGRLSMVRVFATWLQSIDPRNEVPPASLIPVKLRRTRPYIYTGREIEKIVTEAAELPSPYGLRGWTFSTLFGLIAVTGLRISEAIGLDDADVDLDEAVLRVSGDERPREEDEPDDCGKGDLRHRPDRGELACAVGVTEDPQPADDRVDERQEGAGMPASPGVL